MAKEIRAQSRQSSAIHIVQADGSPAIFNGDLAGSPTRLPRRFPQQESPTAMHQLKKASRPIASIDRAASGTVSPEAVLKELFELLEDYGPVWYTEESHNRAVAALAQIMR